MRIEEGHFTPQIAQIVLFVEKEIHLKTMKCHCKTKKWVGFCAKTIIVPYLLNRTKQSMEDEIGERNWLIRFAHKYMKKVLTFTVCLVYIAN